MRKVLRFLALHAVLAFAGCASTTIDAANPSAKIPTGQVVGARYLTGGAGTPVDGDSLSLQIDVNGNLLTSGTTTAGSSTAAIGTVSISIAPVDSDTHTGAILSTGTTRVTLVAASAGRTPYIRGNFRTVAGVTAIHTVSLYSMPSGQLVFDFRLPPDPANGSWNWTQVLHPVQGESLVFAIDSGGAVGDVSWSGTGFYK